MVAALRSESGVWVIGAVEKTIVILHSHNRAGACTICFVGAGLAQAVGPFVGFIESAISASWFTPHRDGTARAGRGNSPAPLCALAAGLIS